MSNNNSLPSAAASGGGGFKKAFRVMLEEDEFHETTLQAADGTLIRVNRYALASRNEYFRKLLLKEPKEEIVEIGFPGHALKAVVEFIHTDDADSLVPNHSSLSEEISVGDFHRLLELEETVEYFDLPELGQKAKESVAAHLEHHPSLALAGVLDRPTASRETRQLAIDKIRQNPVFASTAVETLSLPALKSLLEHNRKESWFGHFEVFELVKHWAMSTGMYVAEGNVRLDAKKAVVEYVDLANIHPEDLSNYVAGSVLVSNQLLTEAFYQAKKASVPVFHKNLSLRWKFSQSQEYRCLPVSPRFRRDLDYVDCEPMKSGIHQWSIGVFYADAASRSAIRIGIVSLRDDSGMLNGSSTSTTGNNEHWNWYYVIGEGDGNVNFRGASTASFFGRVPGATVTLTLDLSPSNAENGSLTISSNGMQPLVMLRNLRGRLLHPGTLGFLPAAMQEGRDSGLEILKLRKL